MLEKIKCLSSPPLEVEDECQDYFVNFIAKNPEAGARGRKRPANIAQQCLCLFRNPTGQT